MMRGQEPGLLMLAVEGGSDGAGVSGLAEAEMLRATARSSTIDARLTTTFSRTPAISCFDLDNAFYKFSSPHLF